MAHQTLAVGVDLGGTTAKAGLISSTGEIIAQSKVPTLADDGPKAVVGQVVKAIEEVLSYVNGATVQ